MATIYEIVQYTQAEVLVEIQNRWGKIKYKPHRDPEDDPNFRFFDRLMRQVPRVGGGS